MFVNLNKKTLIKGKNLPFDDVDVDDVTKTKHNKIIDKFFFYFFSIKNKTRIFVQKSLIRSDHHYYYCKLHVKQKTSIGVI